MILRLGFIILSCIGIVLIGLDDSELTPKGENQNSGFLYGLGKKEQNKVTWKVQEAAIYYSIQKSQDGSNSWQELKRITAKTNDVAEMTFIDEGVEKTTLYRVVVIKKDGSYTSNEIELRRKSFKNANQYSA